jgi:hypothetical protein
MIVKFYISPSSYVLPNNILCRNALQKNCIYGTESFMRSLGSQEIAPSPFFIKPHGSLLCSRQIYIRTVAKGELTQICGKYIFTLSLSTYKILYPYEEFQLLGYNAV